MIMSENKCYDTIMEGCFPNTPSKLMYAKLPFHIHENARVLTVEETRYLLYATTDDFCDYSLESVSDIVEEGFSIEDICDFALWTIYNSQRSFITRDGRMYVASHYFEEGWEWYLDNISTILDTCGKLFKGEATESEINDNPESAF